MATSFDGPATLHIGGRDYPVQVKLATSLGVTYSWQGTATTTDLAALNMQGQGGTLTLPVPPCSGEVHVAVAELHLGGGVLLRLHGVGVAPYQRDGEITATPGPEGSTVYQAPFSAPGRDGAASR